MQAVSLRLRESGKVSPYWAVAEESAKDNPLWSSLPRLKQGSGPLGSRLHLVYAELLRAHSGAILVGADMPHLQAKTVEKFACRLRENSADFSILLAEDGGFTLFAGRKPVPESVWTSVPYSVNDTADRLVKELEYSAKVEIAGSSFDIDDMAGLQKLATIEDTHLLEEQRSLVGWCRDLQKARK